MPSNKIINKHCKLINTINTYSFKTNNKINRNFVSMKDERKMSAHRDQVSVRES